MNNNFGNTNNNFGNMKNFNIERGMKSFLKEIDKVQNVKRVGKKNLTYVEAYDIISKNDIIDKSIANDVAENQRKKGKGEK